MPRDDLEDYLQGSGKLSRTYRQLGNPVPPASVERAILAASRTAGGEITPRPRRVRWALSCAAAACAIFSVGVWYQLDHVSRPGVDSNSWQFIHAASNGEPPVIRHPAVPARRHPAWSNEPVAPLVSHHQLYTTDPPHSRPTQIEANAAGPESGAAAGEMPTDGERDAADLRARVRALEALGRTGEAAKLRRELERQVRQDAPAGR